jgi:hypothetical protein
VTHRQVAMSRIRGLLACVLLPMLIGTGIPVRGCQCIPGHCQCATSLQSRTEDGRRSCCAQSTRRQCCEKCASKSRGHQASACLDRGIAGHGPGTIPCPKACKCHLRADLGRTKDSERRCSTTEQLVTMCAQSIARVTPPQAEIRTRFNGPSDVGWSASDRVIALRCLLL